MHDNINIAPEFENMSTSSKIFVRQAKPEDGPIFLDLKKEREISDITLYDYQANLKIDPNFLLVAANEEGDVLGFIGLTEHNPEVVYIGSYIVRKEFRGTGVGRMLWSTMMDRVADRNLVLDAVLDMVPWYQKQEFQYLYTKVHYYKLVVTENMLAPMTTKYEFSELCNETRIWKDVLNYDKLVYPSVNREHLLRAWLIGENVFTTVAYYNHDVVGYGSIHRKPNGVYGLRNVFADSEEVVEAILRKLFEPLKVGSVVRFSLFDDKPLPEYLRHSESLHNSLQRMFTKSIIEVDTSRIWLYNPHTV